MKLVIILGALLALVVNNLGSPFEERIIGGDYVEIYQVPYQAGLIKNGGLLMCGGSIISEKWILTAAHCIQDENPAYLSIVVGTAEWARGGTRLNISRMIAHPKYNKELYLDYDYALIEVSEPVPIASPYVKTVALATSDPPADSLGVVSGWGLDHDRTSSLKRAQVLIVPREECQKLNGHDSITITDRMICAGRPQGGHNSCYGDSGGPLFIQGLEVQVGIVSWAWGCAKPNSPTVFSSVASQREWIREISGV